MKVRNFALYSLLQYFYHKNEAEDILCWAAAEAQQALID